MGNRLALSNAAWAGTRLLSTNLREAGGAEVACAIFYSEIWGVKKKLALLVEWRLVLLASGAEQSRGLCSCRRRGRQAGRTEGGGGGTGGASGRRRPDAFFTCLASSGKHMAAGRRQREGDDWCSVGKKAGAVCT
jgi:hypothetical protein